jgi:hypothetical protein
MWNQTGYIFFPVVIGVTYHFFMQKEFHSFFGQSGLNTIISWHLSRLLYLAQHLYASLITVEKKLEKDLASSGHPSLFPLSWLLYLAQYVLLKK